MFKIFTLFLQIEAEVLRLEQLKSSKLKEILLKKKLELEEVCRQSHMVTETLSAEYSSEAIESGKFLLSLFLLFVISPLKLIAMLW